MSYKTDTNRNADYAEGLVYCDIINKGWVVLTPSSRDSPYDYVVDMGSEFVKVQVKKLCRNNRLTKRLARGNQKVTENGKVRNTIDYAERGIDWLVGVNIETKEIYYYSINKYSKIESSTFSVSAHKPCDFPINDRVRKNTEGTILPFPVTMTAPYETNGGVYAQPDATGWVEEELPPWAK